MLIYRLRQRTFQALRLHQTINIDHDDIDNCAKSGVKYHKQINQLINQSTNPSEINLTLQNDMFDLESNKII